MATSARMMAPTQLSDALRMRPVRRPARSRMSAHMSDSGESITTKETIEYQFTYEAGIPKNTAVLSAIGLKQILSE